MHDCRFTFASCGTRSSVASITRHIDSSCSHSRAQMSLMGNTWRERCLFMRLRRGWWASGISVLGIKADLLFLPTSDDGTDPSLAFKSAVESRDPCRRSLVWRIMLFDAWTSHRFDQGAFHSSCFCEWKQNNNSGSEGPAQAIWGGVTLLPSSV